MAHLFKIRQLELDFYQFKAGQSLAIVGAGCGHWEAAYAAATAGISFYLEDIDTTKCNKAHGDVAWNHYAKLRGKPMTCIYELVPGDERSTSLPENTFDKIIIINSFHESSKNSCVKDLYFQNFPVLKSNQSTRIQPFFSYIYYFIN